MNVVRTNDTVIIITGKDKGKKGTVLEILSQKGKVLVKGIAIVTRHVKARKQGEVSGIKKNESFIDLSNVIPICLACKKPCRINIKKVNSKRMRVCNRCKEVF